jgi:polysaccharide biosynthesis protein PslH
MRVLVLSSWFPYPPANGSKLRAFHLLQDLAKRHTVTLLSFAEPQEASPEDVAPLREICRTVKIVRGHPFKHGRLRSGGLLSRMPRSLVQTYSLEMQSRIEESVTGHDIAIGLQVGSALYLRGCRSLPRVFEEAEITWLLAQLDGEHRLTSRARLALTWWKYRRFIRDTVARLERTTVVSDVERDALIGIGCEPERVKVVPNGVARADLARPSEARTPRLVYPGAMTYSANHDAVRWFVTACWPLIRRARPELSFVVTGSTTGVDVSDLAACEGVTFTGHVPDVKSVVARSAACVVPLRLGGGTRLKILEAMALGTPVVCTTKGAEGLAVTPEEDILIGDRPETFAAQVIRLLDDPLLAEQLARNGRDLVDGRYTWDKIGEDLETVLQEAVELFHHGAKRR